MRKSFFTIEKDYMQISNRGDTNSLLFYNIILDEKVFTVNRRVKTIIDALAETGGMMGIIYSIAAFMLGTL